MNKVTLIIKCGDDYKTVVIWKVTYIFYNADVRVTIVEDSKIHHSYKVSDIITIDMEYIHGLELE